MLLYPTEEQIEEIKERSQMGDEDVVIPPRDVRDIPSRLREVAERSRMRKEDVNVNPTILEEIEPESIVGNRPRTNAFDVTGLGNSVTTLEEIPEDLKSLF